MTLDVTRDLDNSRFSNVKVGWQNVLEAVVGREVAPHTATNTTFVDALDGTGFDVAKQTRFSPHNLVSFLKRPVALTLTADANMSKVRRLFQGAGTIYAGSNFAGAACLCSAQVLNPDVNHPETTNSMQTKPDSSNANKVVGLIIVIVGLFAASGAGLYLCHFKSSARPERPQQPDAPLAQSQGRRNVLGIVPQMPRRPEPVA